jgi:hypothetical protein
MREKRDSQLVRNSLLRCETQLFRFPAFEHRNKSLDPARLISKQFIFEPVFSARPQNDG